jgi:hypothetical protein
MMNDLITIAQQIRAECREDYVGLWSIVRRIRGAGAGDQSKIVETTSALLKQLLSEGGIIAGQFVDRKFHEWKMSPQEIVAKIECEWVNLGRDPDIGEIAWFVSAGAPT